MADFHQKFCHETGGKGQNVTYLPTALGGEESSKRNELLFNSDDEDVISYDKEFREFEEKQGEEKFGVHDLTEEQKAKLEQQQFKPEEDISGHLMSDAYDSE